MYQPLSINEVACVLKHSIQVHIVWAGFELTAEPIEEALGDLLMNHIFDVSMHFITHKDDKTKQRNVCEKFLFDYAYDFEGKDESCFCNALHCTFVLTNVLFELLRAVYSPLSKIHTDYDIEDMCEEIAEVITETVNGDVSRFFV